MLLLQRSWYSFTPVLVAVHLLWLWFAGRCKPQSLWYSWLDVYAQTLLKKKSLLSFKKFLKCVTILVCLAVTSCLQRDSFASGVLFVVVSLSWRYCVRFSCLLSSLDNTSFVCKGARLNLNWITNKGNYEMFVISNGVNEREMMKDNKPLEYELLIWTITMGVRSKVNFLNIPHPLDW